MIPLLRQQLAAHISHAAKQQPSEPLQETDHAEVQRIKEELAIDLTDKNAQRIAAYRKKKQEKGLLRQLQEELSEFKQVKTALHNRVELLEAELRYYKKMHEEKDLKKSLAQKTELEELLSIEEELYQKAKDTEKLYAQKQLTDKEVQEIEEKLNLMLKQLLKRKEELTE